MAEFRAFRSDIEVNGETVWSVVDGAGAFQRRALELLAACGISDPKPGSWYPQQAWLDSFKRIADTVGCNTLYAIGAKIPANAHFPAEVNSIAKALAAIDVAYHMNHRRDGKEMFEPVGGEMLEGIGHYAFEQVGETQGVVVCTNPYPCDFDRGIIEAMATRFKPAGSLLVRVQHDDQSPCRRKRGSSCTYQVEW